MNLIRSVAVLCFLSLSLGAQEPFVMVVLGDSVSTGYNAKSLGNNWDLSWVSGSNPRMQSHAQRFQAALQVPVESKNLAMPGSKSKDLMKQWKRVGPQKVDYASITIGANDVCGFHSKDFKNAAQALVENIERVIQDMGKSNPSILINLMPLPNLLAVQQLGSKKFACQTIWDLFPICGKILKSKRSEKQRADFQRRLDDINERLEILSRSYPNTRFFRQLAVREIRFADLSKIDCFHPSKKGLQKIAEASWNLLFPGGDVEVRQLGIADKG